MKLTNSTGYDTRALRALTSRALAEVRRTEGTRRADHLHVEVVYSRGEHCTGYAYLGQLHRSGHYALLRVPRTGLTRTRFLWLVYHEAMHLWGYHHGQFSDLSPTAGLRLAGDTDSPVPTKAALQPKPRPTLDEKHRREIVALEARLKSWRTRQKRAKTAIAKVQSMLDYRRREIERRAAAPKEPPQ